MIVTKIKQFKHNGFSLEKLHYMQTFDFDINFIVGGRSNFKTSTLQCEAIDNFFQRNEMSIRLVRFKDDSRKEYIENFFSPYALKHAYNKYHVDIIYYQQAYWFVKYNENNPEEIESKTMFMKIVPLSIAQKFKSNGLEHYTTIIFDEFAPENDTYLPKEVDKLTQLISTVNRNKESGLKVYLIGNMINVDNMYFDFYGIDAMELIVNNIYDFTVDGYQRVGVYVVEPIFEEFKKAPRILRTLSNNVQETSQNAYQLPDDIISINDVFLYLNATDINKFNDRFILKDIINIMYLDEHQFYIGIYIDRFNPNVRYVITEKMDSSDIYMIFSNDYLESNSNFTCENSVCELPVYRSERVRYKYVDRNARKTFKYLLDARYIY